MRRLFAVFISVLLGTVLVAAAAGVAEAATKGPCCGTTMLINKYKGTDSNPSTAKAPGQINVVSGKLANDRGTINGTYSSVQTVLSVSTGGTYEILNTTIYKLPKGTLTTSGPEVWAPGNRLVNTAPQVLAITGGTGLYAGSAGTATSVPNPQSIEVTFTFANK
ncbi:MAG: hypothetical protein PHU75_06825 [Candidatus Nanopelagicales bacterium]|nr:hypothetical protein [Candidatus Nanopelagicales bacterium]